ncbi:MAG: hypothetical protein NWE95_01755 [Candidatus Bathyarchaeota archaeon]|nr:hypothetical protein [Candidatus Bathyarchaeota archaeon]
MDWRNVKEIFKPDKSKVIVFLLLVLTCLTLSYFLVFSICESSMAATASCMISYVHSARECAFEVIHSGSALNKTLINESLSEAQASCDYYAKKASKALDTLWNVRQAITISSLGLVDPNYLGDTPLPNIFVLLAAYYALSCAFVSGFDFLLNRR